MAKVSYVDILPGLENKYWAVLTPQDRWVFSRVTRKTSLLSVKRKKGMTQKSLLPQVAEAWALLSEVEKTNWSNAGAQMGLNGWRLFVQDKCARIKNEMAGNATPNLLHQSWVGQIHIEAPASELKITQLHPHFYWVSKKVTGKKGMYEPVLVTEDLTLPVTISLNYNSDLVTVDGENFSKLYARFWHSYQGQNLYTDLEISLDYVSDWKNTEATLSSLLGYVVGYDLYLWIKGLRGDLFIDNIKVTHDGQNWIRDPWCKDINQGFTRAFYQVPKHWAGVTVPAGAWYESTYKDF